MCRAMSAEAERRQLIASAIAEGAKARGTSRVVRPYYSPRGFGGSYREKEPGVWVASHRRVVLAGALPVGPRSVLRWAEANGLVYWAVVRG